MKDKNRVPGSEPRAYYDSNRFVSAKAASVSNELYAVQCVYPLLIITDPDGNVIEMVLQHPLAGNDLHSDDEQALVALLNKDMQLRYAKWTASLNRGMEVAKILVAASMAGSLDSLLETAERSTDPPGYLVDGVFVSDEQIKDIRESWKSKISK